MKFMKKVLSSFLGKIYEALIFLDRFFTIKNKFEVPVVSVGNIALGGRGKTPFVVELVLGLRARGFNPVVLTRGYGRSERKSCWIEEGKEKDLSTALTGDEAMEVFIKTRAPVLVGANRTSNAKKFLKERPGLHSVVFVLDDGFQHWSLKRDFDLVLVNKNDFLDSVLPCGRLRESVQSLARADLVLERGVDFVKESSFRFLPYEGEGLLVLTTRAEDESYANFFRNFKKVEFIKLADHADASQVLEVLSKTEATQVALGAKEAVKILSIGAAQSFFATGKANFFIKNRSVQIFYVECNLKIAKSEEMWRKILAKVQG